MVEQRLARLDQVAGDQGIALRFGEPAQVARVIVASELAHDPGIEAGAGLDQLLDQAQAHDVALDDGGAGRLGEVLEPEQTGPGVAIQHLDEQADRLAQGRRQPERDRLVQLGRGVRHLGRDQPFQRAGGRKHDVPAAQLVLHTDQKFGGGAALDGALAQPVPQVRRDPAVEGTQAKVASDAQGLRPFRLRPARPVEEQHRRQAELARQVVDDLHRGLAVVVEETAMRTQPAELDGKAAAMVVTPALGGHGQVRGRQAPAPRKLVLVRVGGGRPAPGRRFGIRGIIRRH